MLKKGDTCSKRAKEKIHIDNEKPDLWKSYKMYANFKYKRIWKVGVNLLIKKVLI